jgi:acetylglutamate kinase
MDISETLHIIKIGGNIIDDETRLSAFLDSFSELKGRKILIHGGGKLATRLAKDLNIPQQIIDGRRITDAETLKIITMVYAGHINKNIVAKLQALGTDAIGLTGADGNMIRAHKRTSSTIDYGYVGDVDGVNDKMLDGILHQGLTIVIAPVTHDGNGQLLNTNADTIAQSVAVSLSGQYTVTLVYTFEKPGVLLDVDDERSVIPELNPDLYKRYRSEEKIFAGMIPKIDNAFAALSAGVHKVIIGKAEELYKLTSGQGGTSISL